MTAAQYGPNEKTRQGKCPTCLHAFRFTSPSRLHDAICPRCKLTTHLVRTTYQYNGPWHMRRALHEPDIAPAYYRVPPRRPS